MGAEPGGYLPPRPGRAAVARLLAATYNLEPQPLQPDYAGAAAYLRTRLRRRSLVVLLTDLADPATARELARQVAVLARHHLVLVVSQVDPALVAIARSLPEDAAGAYRKAAALEVLAAREEIRAGLSRAGAVVLDVPPGQLAPALVSRYLELKARNRV
nr:MAG: hypothetical protein DIU70_08030 [Bacillota bacterium]